MLGFLAASEGPAAMLLEGDTGIGKTTLWKSGVAAAQDSGFQVLACRPVRSEASLSYAVLGDSSAQSWKTRFPSCRHRSARRSRSRCCCAIRTALPLTNAPSAYRS